jgi:hypothetical protein
MPKTAKKSSDNPTSKVPAQSSIWDTWPKWIDDDTFQTPKFKFCGKLGDYNTPTTSDQVMILKSRSTLEPYRKLARSGELMNILEIGFYQGGMPLFLADMLSPKKIVAVDRNPAPDAVFQHVKDKKLTGVVEYIGGVDQGDTARLREIVKERFGGEPLDLIIDDCSHFYDLTRGCFEQLFGFLWPGGKYVIEDWGWTHWPSEYYQSSQSPFYRSTSMSNVIFEIIMAQSSSYGLISNVEIANGSCAIVTRGNALSHGEVCELQKRTNIAVGYKANLISVVDKEPTSSATR